MPKDAKKNYYPASFNDYNPILDTDSYKVGMWRMLPPQSEYSYSYIESRGGRWQKTLFYGLQYHLKRYMSEPFVTDQAIDEAEEYFADHFGDGAIFNRKGWEYIRDEHGGYLPLVIKAIPEGVLVPGHNILASVQNTDKKCAWLTTYIEPALLRAIWYPTTVATNSFEGKLIINEFLVSTSDIPEILLPSRLHDFSARGNNCFEASGISGASHLINFRGSDTVNALRQARRYYGAGMAGNSIPASEHSVVGSWGGPSGEAAFMENMIKQFAKPGAFWACVSDTYDLWNAVDNLWGGQFKQSLIDSGSTLVIRPDSGDPTAIPVEVVQRLGAKFGFTVNQKGFKVLNTVRVIQGDGIDVSTIRTILQNLKDLGWSADNIAFGMGGALVQKGIDRDTLKWAMKCSHITVDGQGRDVYKDPVTDPGKRSKRGIMALVHECGTWETLPLDGNGYRDQLRTVYRNGMIMRDESWDEICARSNESFACEFGLRMAA